MENLTPEQKQQAELDNQTRLSLIQAFESLYGNLIAFLTKVNIHPTLKSHCLMNLDQGAFWAREGIRSLVVSVPPAPQPPKADEPSKEKDSSQQESQPQDAA